MSEIEKALRRHEKDPNQSLCSITSAIKKTDTSTLLALLPRILPSLLQMVFDREPSKGDILCMIEKNPSVYCKFLKRYQSISGDEFECC